MLNEILNCSFHQNSNIVDIPGVSKEQAFKFLFEAVMDNKIPVCKPIGFLINASDQIISSTATDRNEGILENMLTIGNNLDFIVMDAKNDRIVNIPTDEKITTKSVWISDGKAVQILGAEKHICTPIENTALRVIIHKGSGYMNMRTTSRVLNDSQYFPICTVFTLRDYIRVLPFTGEVRMVLRNGMTEAFFKQLISEWLDAWSNAKEARTLRKEEIEWLSAYED